MKNKFVIFHISILFFSNLLFAQKNNIRFENISIDQGLSQNSVVSICQDQKGFLWFGTYDGLNRYDGYQFKIFQNNPHDSTSLSKNLIWAICEDKLGNIWVGTDGGLNKLDTGTETFTRFVEHPGKKNSISNNNIRAIYADKNGTLWIGTENGLNIYNYGRNSFSIFKNDPKDRSSLSNNVVRAIFEDSHNNLWIGTDDGLNLFDKRTNKFHRYLQNNSDANGLNSNAIYALGEDSKGFLWIGTRLNGLYRFEEQTQKFKHYTYDPENAFSLRYNYIKKIYKDKSGNLWIGTYGGGLEKYDAVHDGFIHYQNDPSNSFSISSNTIYSIMEDNSGILWIGTEFAGVNKYDKWKNQFAYYSNVPSNPKSLINNNVNCFCENPADKGKNIWLGTWKGLVLFDRQKQEFLTYANNPHDKYSLSNNVVRNINIDKHGNLWIGTDNGLNRFNIKEKKFYRYFNDPNNPNSISNNLIRNILVDHNGRIWIASNSSTIDEYDPVHDCFIHHINDIPSARITLYNIVWVLIEDNRGNILAGSDAGGVSILDKSSGKFIKYLDSESASPFHLNNNKVLTMHASANGLLWIGTAGGGLNCYDLNKQKLSILTEKNGLSSNTIHGIIEDKNGFLWVSTNHGLSRIDSRNNSIVNFNVHDGLQSDEFQVNSFCYSVTGELFFGGIKGFNSFRPEDIKENKFIPPIVLTNIQLFNQSIPIGKAIDGRVLLPNSITEVKQLVLNYSDEVFTIEFSALDYSAPEKNKYSYFLEGYDKIWNYIGNRHIATYTKISPGEYTLFVKGSSHNGTWNNKGTSLKIIITPPFWETLWFRIIAILFIVGILLLSHNIRTRRIIAQNKVLEQHVKERTAELEYANKELEAFTYSVSHDLRAPLRAINGYSKIFVDEYSGKVDQEGRRLLDVIVASSIKMGNLINELLQFSRASRTELKKQVIDVEKQVDSVINELLENSNRRKNEFKINTLPKMYGDVALMKQVWQNLISNAVKFSSKVSNPEIEIGVLTEGINDIYFVKDNGAGFNNEYSHKLFGVFQRLHNDSEFEGVGAGLAIVQRIIQRHNGRIWAEGQLNKGATFYFLIPRYEAQND